MKFQSVLDTLHNKKKSEAEIDDTSCYAIHVTLAVYIKASSINAMHFVLYRYVIYNLPVTDLILKLYGFFHVFIVVASL